MSDQKASIVRESLRCTQTPAAAVALNLKCNRFIASSLKQHSFCFTVVQLQQSPVQLHDPNRGESCVCLCLSALCMNWRRFLKPHTDGYEGVFSQAYTQSCSAQTATAVHEFCSLCLKEIDRWKNETVKKAILPF